MIHLVSILLCLAGFTALACAMERQQQDIFGHALPGPITKRLRMAGTCALLAALAVVLAGQGWGLGLVIYSGHTSFAAGAVYCILIRCYAR
ncbi:MAG TPA: DUF3325 domain-containing protein [Burkholderiaceae bacterium]|nr:DUF3325 domain-containing protein [Burkholderiaceae bacterium]